MSEQHQIVRSVNPRVAKHPPGPAMTLDFIEPCLPVMSRTVPTGTGWAYEIKHEAPTRVCVCVSISSTPTVRMSDFKGRRSQCPILGTAGPPTGRHNFRMLISRPDEDVRLAIPDTASAHLRSIS
jgi:hypothetical protein